MSERDPHYRVDPNDPWTVVDRDGDWCATAPPGTNMGVFVGGMNRSKAMRKADKQNQPVGELDSIAGEGVDYCQICGWGGCEMIGGTVACPGPNRGLRAAVARLAALHRPASDSPLREALEKIEYKAKILARIASRWEIPSVLVHAEDIDHDSIRGATNDIAAIARAALAPEESGG